MTVNQSLPKLPLSTGEPATQITTELTTNAQPVVPTAISQAILVGIDWADRLHAYHAIYPDGSISAGTFKQSPHDIANWLAEVQARLPGVRLNVCLETSRGALINVLVQYPMIAVFPVNPNALANYHKAFNHGGGKSDPVDARLIAQYLQHYRERLLPLRKDQPLTRELATLCEDRRGLVDQRVGFANELISLLKQYLPVILDLQPANIYADFVIKLLTHYAGLSLVKCKWAKAYYDSMLKRGKSPQMARRALAYKWLRIIYRCWQNHEAYDDARYSARLVASGSPLAKQLV